MPQLWETFVIGKGGVCLQINELQAMTVIQLRKLARENKVKLSAGIDKEGIVQRLYEALGDQKDFSVQSPKENAPAPAAAEPRPPVEKPAPPKENGLEESLAADVTSVQPGSGYRPWSAERAEENDGHFHPVFRQGWQARAAAQRETPARPAWQQQRPVGAANRFGPQASSPGAQPIGQQEERQESFQPRISENAPRLDGYRLGYRAVPQRPSYQNRDSGYRNPSYGGNASYGGNGYSSNSYNSGYRQNNYRQQPAYGGYPQQQPVYPPRGGADSRLSDSIYRMGRDQQFSEQAEAGMLPDLLKVPESKPVSGILEVLPDGYGFLRSGTLLPGRDDSYVSMAQIRRYDLRTGDFIEGGAKAQRDNEKFAALLVVDKVNGIEAEENPQRLNFDQLTPVYPNKRVVLEAPDGGSSMLIRLVDLIAPIGFGQRAMIVSPPNSDSLSILRDIGCAIKRNDENAEVLMLLIDVAPEEVTEIRESAAGEVFASTFADSPEMQTRVSETMLERAQRLVESGKNVVILLDSLTKLTRAYQGTLVQGSRPMSNTVTPAALVRPKRFFGAARNTREGGSLTVVATINVNTGSRVDDIIYEEFRGTANMELFLLSPSDGDPIHPMIDLQRCGTKKDDMLLDDERKESLRSIRKVLGSATNGEAVVQLIDMMKKTRCNEDLMARLKEWVALWEKSGYLKK